MALESRNDAQQEQASLGRRFGRASAVLVSSLLLTALAALLSERFVAARLNATVESAADQEMARLESRLSAYVALLRATRSFVEADGAALNGKGFATFVAGLRIPSDYPGIQGIGWSPRVGTSGSKFEIVYLEPLDARNRAALGFNMYSEPVRADAMDRARDNGSYAMSGSVVLKQEILPDISPGFLIYTPVYHGAVIPASIQERRQRLRGFVYAPFRASDFFGGLFRDGLVRVVAIHVSSAGREKQLLFGKWPPPQGRLLAREHQFGGQSWTLQFDAVGELPLTDRLLPLLVLSTGMLISLLLFQLTRAQTRARLKAEERALDLSRQVQFAEMLVGIVSHDLRNPLNVVHLNAALLARTQLAPEQARSVQRIQSSSDMGLRMIRDLLDFTQARLAGGIPVMRRPGDLFEVVRHAVEQARIAHPQREIVLTAGGNGDGEWDSDRIAQLISNLLSNALVYGSGHAPITVAVSGGDDGCVSISVHNEGVPIPPEMQQALFEPLRQGDSRAGASSRNIGLGLYIVQQIARAHAGVVHCRSTDVEGTTFEVELPRQAQAAC